MWHKIPRIWTQKSKINDLWEPEQASVALEEQIMKLK